jgi:sterol desaturase/sphingolipid hydroxylase (fatty acid hydroxylase superfamily)
MHGGLGARRLGIFLAILGIIVVCGAAILLSEKDGPTLAGRSVVNFRALCAFLSNHFLSRWFPLFFCFVFLLECVKPAQRGSGIFSRGFAYDASIGVLLIIFQFMVVSLMISLLFAAYAKIHAPLLSSMIEGRRNLPTRINHSLHRPPLLRIAHWQNAALAAFGLAVGDFLSWASHLVRHKVPALWRLHAMHHSQHELNIFTEFRSHPLDALASSAMQSLPLYLLGVPFTISVTFLVFYKYYLMFTHANVDIDYGWVGKILVSPKFHRVHHASEPALHDHNYGAVLSIWDGLFGTAKTGVANSPATGVDDAWVEHERSPRSAVPLYLRQLAAPFRSVSPSAISADRNKQ